MRHLGLLIGVLIAIFASAQSAYQHVGDSLIIRLNSNGILAIDPATQDPDCKLPQAASHFLNQAGLWIVAEDNQGNFYTSVQHIKSNDSFDFWPGPVDTLTGQTGSIAAWDKVWSVRSEVIAEHKERYNEAGYNVPAEIADWPVAGTNGFNTYLAPFVDINNNKTYDPENGDYPHIKGEVAHYCIFNDLADEHTASLGAEIGIEVHLMAYTLRGSNSVFLEYFIVPRKSTNYTDVKVGFFLGGECGNINDNFAGTNLQHPRSVFIYNGDNHDDNHFGDDLPYVSATFLNRDLDASMHFYNSTDNYGTPYESNDYRLLLNNRWKDSTRLSLGGTGSGGSTFTPTSFAHNTGSTSTDWSEEMEGNTPGERNILGIVHAGSMKKGDFIKLDLCISAGLTTSSEIKNAVMAQSMSDLALFRSTSTIPRLPRQKIGVYPNPNNGKFTLEALPGSEILITNNQGVTVYSIKNNKNISLPCNIYVAPGVYFVEIRNTMYNFREKMIVSH